MTMPFTRSIRALRTDREWPTLTILVSAMILIGFWLIWFLWASIPLYEVGRMTNTTRYGAMIAIFSAEAASHLRPGQIAQIRSQEETDTEALAQGSPVMVMLINPTDENGQVEVELASLSNADQLRQSAFTQAQVDDDLSSLVVEVEVDRLSPAQWIWRASGQWIDTPSVTLRPQSQ